MGSPRADVTNRAQCTVDVSKARSADVAGLGRVAASRPEAPAKHAVTSRRQSSACWQWDASAQPAWLTAEFYIKKIQPRLAEISGGAIASSIGSVTMVCRTHPTGLSAASEALAGIGGISGRNTSAVQGSLGCDSADNVWMGFVADGQHPMIQSRPMARESKEDLRRDRSSAVPQPLSPIFRRIC